MFQISNLMAILLCWVGFTLHLQGQALKPQPPAFGVADNGGFFNKDSGTFKRISDQLLKLQQDCGYKIYLVVEPVLISATASEHANELRQAWLPKGDGVVIVYEASSGSRGIGYDRTSNVGNDGKSGTEAEFIRIPTHELNAILSQAVLSVDEKLAPEPRLEALVNALVTDFDSYFKRRDTPPPAERSVKLTFLVIGTLALLGLGAIGLGGLVRHTGMAGIRSFRFPPVDIPERLGAPCGATVTTRSFGSRQPK